MAASPGITTVVNWADARALAFPVSGAGSNIPVGTIMVPGQTGGTNAGVLIPAAATSAAASGYAGVLGVLAAPHVFATSGDATTATLVQWFEVPGFSSISSLLGVAITTAAASSLPSHAVDLLDTAVLVKMSYNLASTLAVASATTTVLTITSEVSGQDSAFVYVNAGTGLGQLGFIKSSGSGSLTLTSALTTTLDSTSKLTKIQPLFWQNQTLLINTTTQSTLLDSAPGIASSGARATPVANFISINGLSQRMDPKILHNMQNLNKVSALDFYSYLAFGGSALHPNA